MVGECGGGGGGEIWGERDTLSPPDKSPEAICASHSFLSLTFQPQIFQVNPGILGPPPRQQAPGRPPEALKECFQRGHRLPQQSCWSISELKLESGKATEERATAYLPTRAPLSASARMLRTE